jgi:hypothetical protein
MNNKQKIWNFASIFIILILAIVSSNLFSHQNDLKEEIAEWKNEANSLKEIPNLNEQASTFINALNQGNSKEYLTGKALETYNAALEGEDEYEHNHSHTGEQTVDILQSETIKSEQDTGRSKVLYKLSYKGEFDQEDIGTIHQRTLFLLMDIEWTKEKSDYKVSDYKVELLNDNWDDYILSLEKKGDESE